MRGFVVPLPVSFATVIAVATLFGSVSASADELAVIRASVKQRLSLLQTLDVELRAWTDTEFSRVPPDVQLVEGETRIHWMTDRGKVFYGMGSAGDESSRVFYDGRSTTILDGSRAYIHPRPPSNDRFSYAVLADLLGLMWTWSAGDLNQLLAASDATIVPDWTPPRGACDVAVACTHQDRITYRMHIGFDASHDFAPSVIYGVSADGQHATWCAEDWMSATSDITEESVWIPRRARYTTWNDGNDTRYSSLAEVTRMSLPQSISDENFHVSISPGTEVWEDSTIAGRPPRTYLAGGAAAVTARAVALSRDTEAAIAMLKASGKTFSGKPQSSSMWWLFVIVGAALIAAGLVWRRLRSH